MMTTVLLWLSILAVWTPQSLAQAGCPFVRGSAQGNESATSTSLDTCLSCLGSTCGFVYFSPLLPGLPCRQILSGTSSLTTMYAYRQCGAALDCNSPACNGTCSPCTESRIVSFSETCNVNGGVRTCMQRRCRGSLVRIRVSSPSQAAMAGNCEGFCNLQQGCEAFVETNTSCVTLQRLPSQSVNDLVLATSTGCVMETVTDFCFVNPCQNNGTCLNRANNFECLCPQGFSGPTCSSLNVCPCVTTTEGVTVMVSSFGAGANVTYMCLDNFLPISGNALRTCQSNGTWTGSPLMCDRVVTYLADLRVAGPVFSVISLTLFGNRSSSPTINLRLVSWGFFARGVRIPIRSPDVGLVQRAVVEAFTGIRFPSSFLTLQLFVTAPNGARFTFPTTSLTGGDVRDLPATLV